MNSSEVPITDLEARFVEEYKVLARQSPVDLRISPLHLWALFSAVQLACRHPNFSGPARDLAEDAARQIQARIAPDGALAEVAEMGWHPEFDKATHD